MGPPCLLCGGWGRTDLGIRVGTEGLVDSRLRGVVWGADGKAVEGLSAYFRKNDRKEMIGSKTL